MKKRNLKIIIISIIVFMLFNFLGGLVIGWSGQTKLDITLGFLAYATWGLIFGILVIFVDWMIGRKKK